MPVRFTWGDGDVYLPLKMPEDNDHLYSSLIKLKPGVQMESENAPNRIETRRPFSTGDFRCRSGMSGTGVPRHWSGPEHSSAM